MSNIIRLGGGGKKLNIQDHQFFENGDYFAADFGLDGFKNIYINVHDAAGAYAEDLTIVFGSNMIGETWTCKATGDDAQTEEFTGVVDETQLATITLTQSATEYEIECTGVAATFTTGGYSTFNLGAAAKIINSITNLAMESSPYTDSYGITYTFIYDTVNSWWRPQTPNLFGSGNQNTWGVNHWAGFEVSTPCKIKEYQFRAYTGGGMTWLFQGSEDGITWDTISTETKTTNYESDYIAKANPAKSYSYYRWYITETKYDGTQNGKTWIKITKATG